MRRLQALSAWLCSVQRLAQKAPKVREIILAHSQHNDGGAATEHVPALPACSALSILLAPYGGYPACVSVPASCCCSMLTCQAETQRQKLMLAVQVLERSCCTVGCGTCCLCWS